MEEVLILKKGGEVQVMEETKTSFGSSISEPVPDASEETYKKKYK